MANPDVAGHGTFTPGLGIGEVLRIAATGAAVVLALSAVSFRVNFYRLIDKLEIMLALCTGVSLTSSSIVHLPGVARLADEGTFDPAAKCIGPSHLLNGLAFQVVAMVVNSMGGAVELAQFNFVNPVPQMQRVKKLKMPSANVDMIAQYFLKDGVRLSPQVREASISHYVHT